MEVVNKTWKLRSLATGEDTPNTSSPGSPLPSIPALLWSQVYHKLLPVTELIMGAGGYHVIKWSHRYFSEFATSRYLSSKEEVRKVYGHLADYFSGKCVLPRGNKEEHSKLQGGQNYVVTL